MRADRERRARALLADALSGTWSLDAILARWDARVYNSDRMQALASALIAAWPGHRQSLPDLDTCWSSLDAGQRRMLYTTRWRQEMRQPELAPPAPVRCPPAIVAVPATLEALARSLGSDADELLWLSGRWLRPRGDASGHYLSRLVRKADGGQRLIEAPKSRLMGVQRQILRRLLQQWPVTDAAHGFVGGRSALTHARLHCNAGWVLRVDLADWFLSIHFGRVHRVYRQMGLAAPLATLMSELSTVCQRAYVLDDPRARAWSRERHLPQGAPTSPALANAVARQLDHRLVGYARARDWRYSRYADDLVFSAVGRMPPMAAAIADVSRIVADEGFHIHAGKTRIRASHQQQRVTGIIVNERLNLRRPEFDQLKAELHAWRRAPDAGTPAHAARRAHLLGRVSWVSQLNPRRGERLMRYLEGMD